MKMTLFLLLAAVLAAPAPAQDKAAAEKPQAAAAAKKPASRPAPEKDAAKAAAAQPQSKPAPAAKAARPAQAKPPAEEPEESMVMIDSKPEPEETGRFSAAAFSQEPDDAPAVPGGLPSSYGQLKGIMNDGGRTLLVLESPDDGAITFVQVTAGKSAVSWKLLDRIPRSLD